MKKNKNQENRIESLLRDILITQLGIAGLTQLQIREVVGGDIYKVNRILKFLKKKEK